MSAYGAGAYAPDRLHPTDVSRGGRGSTANGFGHAQAGRGQASQSGSKLPSAQGFELVDGGRLLLVLLEDTSKFEVAVELLKGTIADSMASLPKNRKTGLIVLRKGVVLSTRTAQARLRELAAFRIMVRTSDHVDLRVGARHIQKQVMDQYEIAANHAKPTAGPSASVGSPSM